VKAFETNERLSSHTTGVNTVCPMVRGAPKGGCQKAAPLPQIKIKKTIHFVDIIPNVLHDLPFSQNEPMKSAGN
jgi:hypothetical protein